MLRTLKSYRRSIHEKRSIEFGLRHLKSVSSLQGRILFDFFLRYCFLVRSLSSNGLLMKGEREVIFDRPCSSWSWAITDFS
mmetsp:Transcript_2902/g.6732  ORF Transcript_2902/g.6732 Transcript_2902/m.6732 type:complete len:81 (-) Transcript_2902:33-275(-)